MVILCPDCTTAWNVRKKFLDHLRKIDKCVCTCRMLEELSLCRIALRTLPKSTESFAHRRWVLKCLINDCCSMISTCHKVRKCNVCRKLVSTNKHADVFVHLTKTDVKLLREELLFCSDAANWHPCNYSCWSHRVWVVDTFIVPHLLCRYNPDKSNSINEEILRNLLEILINESCNVMKWMESHVSDHSCMSYLHFIIDNLLLISFLQNNKCCMCFPASRITCSFYSVAGSQLILTKAIEQCEELLVLYKGEHEAMWCHKRALVVLQCKYFFDAADQRNEKELQEINTRKLLKKEKDFCANFYHERTNPDVVRYVDHYLKYLSSNVS